MDLKLESKSLSAAAAFYNFIVISPGTTRPHFKRINLTIVEGAFSFRFITDVYLERGINEEILT